MSELSHPANITFFSAILLAGATLGVFLVLVLLSVKHGYKRANSLLAILLMLFVLDLLDEFNLHTGLVHTFPRFGSLNWALDLWFGPLAYLYTLSVTDHLGRNQKHRRWPHLVLPILGVCCVTVIGAFHTDSQYSDLLRGNGPMLLDVTQSLLVLSGVVSMVIYVALSLVILRRHSKRTGELFSYREKVSLNWLRNLLSALAVLVILYLTLGIVTDSVIIMNRIFYIAIITVIFGIGYLGIKQPRIFIHKPDLRNSQVVGSENEKRGEQTKYQKSALSEAESRAVFEEATQLLESKQLFRVNDLSLPVLAGELGLPSHYVSQAINQVSGSNFFDLINRHRTQYLREVLAEEGKRSTKTILQHALDAGFNSKSAFYTTFKNHTGQSPRQFIESVTKHNH